MTPLRHPHLSPSGVTHGFFGREGGVSQGLYHSLNCGPGSRDDPDAVRENRARAMRALNILPERLATLYQVHSATALAITAPFAPGTAPQADGMATRERGLALGVLAADCAPLLFLDAKAGVIGAAHAGWKGALAGVAEATLAAMEGLGARRGDVSCVIGPCISQAAYEVGDEFRARFLLEDAGSEKFFVPGVAPGKFQFDLPGYLLNRLARAGVAAAESLGVCTYGAPSRYFSYRRTTHAGEPDYGRNLSAIALSA